MRTAFVLGTRGSALARAQTRIVREALARRHPHLAFSERIITTAGDVRLDVPLALIGGQGIFVAEIERALHDGRVDIAVHSAKDLPSALAPGMRIAAMLQRADPRDVLVSRAGTLGALAHGARVGTSSPRRVCQLRAIRSDLLLADLRGNVDSRVAKLDRGDYDAIVLAAAGLIRLGLESRITEWLPADVMLPMVAQGAIALEIREDDVDALAAAEPLNHRDSAVAVSAERAFLLRLGAGCLAPLAAHATVSGDVVALSAMIGDATGRQLRGTRRGAVAEAASSGTALAEELLGRGGDVMLDAARAR